MSKCSCLFSVHISYCSAILSALYLLKCKQHDVSLERHKERTCGSCSRASTLTHNYQHLLAMAFAVKEIHENPKILPNVSLGFLIHDSIFHEAWIFIASMELLSTQDKVIPNYKCGVSNTPVVFIGGPNPTVTLHMALLLYIYKIPQVRGTNE